MTQPTQGAFWNERYRNRGEAFGTEPNAFLASKASLLQSGWRVLLPGDGEGRNGVWLAERGLVVDTVDASEQAVANARSFAAERGVTINAECADLAHWTWPSGRYDAVVSIFVHFTAATRTRMHAAMLGAVKPGGLVIIEGYGPGQLAHHKAGSVGGPQTEEGLFSREKLAADFAGADIVELTDAETVLAEGVRHRGPSSVVRLVARRR